MSQCPLVSAGRLKFCRGVQIASVETVTIGNFKTWQYLQLAKVWVGSELFTGEPGCRSRIARLGTFLGDSMFQGHGFLVIYLEVSLPKLDFSAISGADTCGFLAK